MAAFEIVPPQPYQPLWLILGAIAGLLAIAAVLWLFFDMRQPKPIGGARPSLLSVRDARAKAMAGIDEVERRFAAGTLDLRGAHLELSWLVRTFVAENSHLDPRSLTAGEVSASQKAPDLADMLNRFEQPTFAEDPEAVVRASAELARGVIGRW